MTNRIKVNVSNTNNVQQDCYKIISTFTGAGGLDIGFHGDFDFLGKKFNKFCSIFDKSISFKFL